MPDRLALMGGGDGPWVDISKVRKPVLQITGLSEGAEVHLHMNGLKDPVAVFIENGEHDFPAFDWARVTCTKPTKKLICVFTSRKVA